MDSKANSCRYNCFHRAEPDEPVFVLLSQRKSIPLVRLWAAMELADPERALEAFQEVLRIIRDCADAGIGREERAQAGAAESYAVEMASWIATHRDDEVRLADALETAGDKAGRRVPLSLVPNPRDRSDNLAAAKTGLRP